MKYFLFAFSLLFLVSCGKKDKEYRSLSKPLEARAVIVEKIDPAGPYTYLSVREGDESFWIAVNNDEFKAGETLYFKSYMEMTDFESRELEKTFEKILFVDQVSRDPDELDKQAPATENASPHGQNPMDVLIDSIKIEPAPGGMSIAELYKQAESFDGKTVVVRGQIVKINRDIMDRNWVHLMDGTRVDRSDLTCTTTEVFEVGDTITLRGKVAVNKDFGMGYVYPLIVEEAEEVQ